MAMLGKKPKPVIGILSGSLLSGNRSGITLLNPSQRPPADPEPRSPKKAFDLGAVGLGIVAALEKTGEFPANRALFSRKLSRSSPIPVKNSSRYSSDSEEMEMERFEEYTIVTCHGLNASYTKVYGDGRKGGDRTPFRILNDTVKSNRTSVFHISPPKSGETTAVPPPDFLSSCYLCNKKLHGKDIYMYRGEKAFCSTECRHRQMLTDERKEKCSSSEASIRAVEVASPTYSNGQILTTGILAI